MGGMGTLTEHFSRFEFEDSATASAVGIPNKVPLEWAGRLKALAENMEKVRALLGHPISVSSGYRSPALNALVRGVSTSAHCECYAADFTCPSFGTPEQIVRAIHESDIPFDQCIMEGHWVHISFAPAMRREELTAHFDAVGNAIYTRRT